MLGSTRLQSFFGAVREGTNTAGVNVLKNVLSGYADQGMAVMFLRPGEKTPADYRTQKQKDAAEAEAAAQGKKPKRGLYLATSDKNLLNQYLTAARKSVDGPDADPNAIGGLTPLNFGIVPDKSRVVVVDCDTQEETDAFRNWVMDHTAHEDLAYNMDITQPSVISPGSVRGGNWETAAEEMVDYDYDVPVYYPPIYRNRGGEVVHANGGHWYFFYPEDYCLPEDARNKITVVYDATSRTPILERIRSLKDQLSLAQNQHTYDQVSQELAAAEQELAEVKRKAQCAFDNPQVTRDDKGHLLDGFSQFVIMLHSSYVIIPPSSRFEGHYRVSDGTGDMPWEPWLEQLISTNMSPAKDPASTSPTPPSPAAHTASAGPLVVADDQVDPPKSSVVAGGDIDEYAAVTSYGQEMLNEIISQWAWPTRWAQILEPHGWVATGEHDPCGCEIFTAPGLHSSPKSATAHDNGCEMGCSELGRLRIWTDNPGDPFDEFVHRHNKRDFSKMTVKALLDYDGDNAAAIRGEGLELPMLPDDTMSMGEDFKNFFRDFMDSSLAEQEQSAMSPMEARRARNKITFTRLSDLSNVKPPRYLVADTIEDNSFSAIIGPSGSGKSFAAIDLACSLATGGYWMGKQCRKRKVGYLAGEGREGVIERFRAWNTVHKEDTGDTIFIADHLPTLKGFDWKDYTNLADTIVENGIDIVILDTWSRAIAGVDENAAEDISHIIATLDQMRDRANCSVLVIHHTAKEASHARGSSAFNAALDTEILVKKVDEDPDPELHRRLLSIEVTKQKNTEAWNEPRYAQIINVGEDRIEIDEENFAQTIKAPAVIGDLNGNFGSDDGIGGAWLLEENKARNSMPLPSIIEILDAIYDACNARSATGGSQAEIIRAVLDRLDDGAQPTSRLREEVTALFNEAVIHRMIVHKAGTTTKFVLPRSSVPSKSPKEVATEVSANRNIPLPDTGDQDKPDLKAVPDAGHNVDASASDDENNGAQDKEKGPQTDSGNASKTDTTRGDGQSSAPHPGFNPWAAAQQASSLRAVDTSTNGPADSLDDDTETTAPGNVDEAKESSEEGAKTAARDTTSDVAADASEEETPAPTTNDKSDGSSEDGADKVEEHSVDGGSDDGVEQESETKSADSKSKRRAVRKSTKKTVKNAAKKTAKKATKKQGTAPEPEPDSSQSSDLDYETNPPYDPDSPDQPEIRNPFLDH